MQIKSTDLINLKILTRNDGTHVEDVKDIIYDPEKNQVRALLIDDGGWFSDAKILMFEDIAGIGKDAIMIESEEVIKSASEVSERISNIASNDKYLTKTKIITENGTELGEISDIYFDDQTGAVEEFEVSQGLKNLQSGKKRVKVSDIITIGKDATIVRDEAEYEIDKQADKQGLQGAYNTATSQESQQTAQNLLSKAENKLSEINQDIKDKIQDVKNSPKTENAIDEVKNKVEQTKEEARDKKIKDIVGKYLTVNLLSSSDEVIAHRGEMITHEILQKAELEGLIEKVAGNNSEKPINL